MKFWKKGLSLVMALGLSVSAVGCFNDSSSSGSSGAGGSGDSSSSGVRITKDIAMAKLTETLEATKSFKVDLDFAYAVTGDGSVVVDGELLVSLDDNGADMKATITVTETYETETNTQSMVAYLIDDYAYNYDAETNTYMKSTMSLSQLIEGALAETGLTATQVGEYVTELESVLTQAGVTEEAILAGLKDSAVVSDNVMSWSVEYKEDVNALIDFLAAYDTNKTLEVAINEVLTAIGADTNVDEILDAIGALGTLKVSQAVAAVDAYLMLNYEMNLQTVFDAALADETVVAALTSAGLTADMIETLKQIEIADLVTEYGEMTMDDVLTIVVMMFGAEETDGAGEDVPAITLQAITDMLKEQFEVTKIADLSPAIAEAQDALEAMEVTKFGGDVAVSYDSAASLSEIAMEAGVSFTVAGAGTASVTFGFTVSEFSANAITIALPTGATEVTPQ